MNVHARRDGHGQALVEFALIFPVLVVLLFGILDFGRAIYDYNTLANAARAGVRVAVVNQNPALSGCAGGSTASPPNTATMAAPDCAIQAAIAMGSVTATVAYMDSTDQNPCAPLNAPLQVGCLAEVKVTYAFHPITPIISSIVSSISMSSTSKQPVEFVCPVAPSTLCALP